MFQSIYFIDTQLSDYQSVIDSLSSTDTHYLINSSSDGLNQMASILSGYSSIDTLHVFSHGSIGSLNLGSTIVNQSNIASYQSQLETIGSSLTANGDILFYGCDVAQGDVGQTFINTIANYTRADVAASSDITGSSALGGNWELEANSGSIEAQALVASYTSTMGTTMVQLEAIGNTAGADSNPRIAAVGTAGEYVVAFVGVDSAGDNSIFVQKFNANGTTAGSMVQLEAIGNTTGADAYARPTAVGTTGEYVVTFEGQDSQGDKSIFIQKFNANGTVQGSMVQLEGNSETANESFAKSIAVGTAGDYVVVFERQDSTGDKSVFVQKFNANGTTAGSIVHFNSNLYDFGPRISAVGTAGEYVVTFHTQRSVSVQKFNSDGTAQGSMVQLVPTVTSTDIYVGLARNTSVGTAGEYVVIFSGADSAGDSSIFVQKFNANGTAKGSMVQLEAIGNTTGSDVNAQVTSVGTTGEYVVAFVGVDSAGDNSIFVQKFNTDGRTAGSMVQLEAIGNTVGAESNPRLIAVGTAGEYVVTFSGADSAEDDSIFVQKFNADGTVKGSMVQLEAIGTTTGADVTPQIISVGTTGEYVVTFAGVDSAGDNSIFVQNFNSNDTIKASVIPTTATALAHLSTYGVTIQQAQDYIVANLSSPSTIYNTCSQYHVSNQMIVEIFDNAYSIDTVKGYFSANGLNPASLDIFS